MHDPGFLCPRARRISPPLHDRQPLHTEDRQGKRATASTLEVSAGPAYQRRRFGCQARHIALGALVSRRFSFHPQIRRRLQAVTGAGTTGAFNTRFQVAIDQQPEAAGRHATVPLVLDHLDGSAQAPRSRRSSLRHQ